MTKTKQTADGGSRKAVVVVTAGEVEEGGPRAGAEWGVGLSLIHISEPTRPP